jgi:hypothetical protein
MEFSELDAIGRRTGTDKSSIAHNYLKLYERRLSHLRHAGRFLLVEIGVYMGQSLVTWSGFFPEATIVGLDINPACGIYDRERMYVRIGDQSDAVFLKSVIDEFGFPSVVIDDGSHRWDHQILSFRELFSVLLPSGIYILEDIDTSFKGYENAGHDYKGTSAVSAYDYVAKLARLVTGGPHAQDEEFDAFMRSWAPHIESIEFASQTAIISKR